MAADTCGRRNFLGGSISLVMIEPVFTIVGHVEVIESVVVVVPYAGSLSPPGKFKPSSSGDIRKCPVVDCCETDGSTMDLSLGLGQGWCHSPEKYPAIVVVVKNRHRHPTARRFYNVLLGVSSPLTFVMHSPTGPATSRNPDWNECSLQDTEIEDPGSTR
jgi:hypothetical protein